MPRLLLHAASRNTGRVAPHSHPSSSAVTWAIPRRRFASRTRTPPYYEGEESDDNNDGDGSDECEHGDDGDEHYEKKSHDENHGSEENYESEDADNLVDAKFVWSLITERRIQTLYNDSNATSFDKRLQLEHLSEGRWVIRRAGYNILMLTAPSARLQHPRSTPSSATSWNNMVEVMN